MTIGLQLAKYKKGPFVVKSIGGEFTIINLYANPSTQTLMRNSQSFDN